MMDVCLLGTAGTMPVKERFLSSLALRIDGHCALIDCGEGTQVAFRASGFSYKHLDLLCITHFHADHVSGLPGLLLTMGNEGRREPLTVCGPVGVEAVVNSLRIIAPELPYEIKFISFKDEPVNFSASVFRVDAIPLKHTVPCFGYVFNLPRSGLFSVEKARSANVPLELWGRLQNGMIIEKDGRVFTPDMVAGPPRRGIKLAFFTDTRCLDSMAPAAYDADLLVCEGMYGDDDKAEMAFEKCHMTFSEAAKTASSAGVRELWLTHFSPSMREPGEFIQNATDIFENTVLGCDGLAKELNFKQDEKE